MTKSLYCLNDPYCGGITFSAQPYAPCYWERYGSMDRKIGLKSHLQWREVQHLQNIIKKSDIWEDFPAVGYSLVAAEVKAGDEDQRIDILYIRDDGALLPCELKIGGESKDTHGQLIRYIADLQNQMVGLSWIRDYHNRFLESIDDNLARYLHSKKFDDFVNNNALEDRFIRLLPKSGVIMDESFKPQLLKAVRYLNGYCGFAIRLLKIETYVENSWNPDLNDYIFRIDFVDIQ